MEFKGDFNGMNMTITTFWRLLLVMVSLYIFSTVSPTFNESFLTSLIISFSGIYYSFIPMLEYYLLNKNLEGVS